MPVAAVRLHEPLAHRQHTLPEQQEAAASGLVAARQHRRVSALISCRVGV